MRIYLDNNATTPVHPDVLATLDRALREWFGNASSIHGEGRSARHAIEDAREAVARLIGAAAREVVFTSGGTESNNAAIFGRLSAVTPAGLLPTGHIVTTGIEHPSVLEAIAKAEERGWRVTRVAAGAGGAVRADDVLAAIRPDTMLVAVMLANNETGVVQPVAAIGRVTRERGIHLHCDAVQAAGKIAVDVESLAVDTLALSAHKLHAPKGIGALYVRRGALLDSWLVGGAQERRRRAGTENVPLAAAFGVAATLAATPEARERLATLRDRFETRLAATSESFACRINGANEERVPNTSNVTFPGADAEGLVIGLDLSGVAVSTGSACSSGRVEPSHVLLAMGMTAEDAKATVRFSVGRLNEESELDRVVDLLRTLVPRCVNAA